MDVFVVVILMVVVGGAISAAFANNEGRELAQKFANLGVLRGKTQQVIIDAVGEGIEDAAGEAGLVGQ